MYSDIFMDENKFLNLEFKKENFKILQLTDMHLGYGFLSKSADKKVLEAIKKLVDRSNPDLIILTGDMIFPFLPKAGTLNNIKQMEKLVLFMDSFKIPYSMVFGNHDLEMGSKGTRDDLAKIIKTGEFSIFDEGLKEIYGVGNFIINLRRKDNLISSLVMLDSNMYGDGWFFSGFDCIHKDQIDWCNKSLNKLKKENINLKAHAFFHMPLKEYKIAYEKMKLGDKCVIYNFGSIAEENDYFGISKYDCMFFDSAVQNGIIKSMCCGHDHLNTISMTYKDIELVYGMSLDFHAYKGIKKRYTQRGGTIINILSDGNFNIEPLPLDKVVSKFVRGKK